MYPQEIDDAGEFWADYSQTPSAPLSPVTGLKPTPRSSGAVPSSTPSISVSSDYSSTGSSPSLPETHIGSLGTPADGRAGDDSYWALYASVGGTADSTHPSPRLPDGKKQILDEYGRPILADGLEEEGKGGLGYVEYEPSTTEDWRIGEAPESFEQEENRREADLDRTGAPSEVKEIQERLLGLGLEGSPLGGTTPMIGSGRVGLPESSSLAVMLQGAYSKWRAQNPEGKIDDFLAVVRSAVLP